MPITIEKIDDTTFKVTVADRRQQCWLICWQELS